MSVQHDLPRDRIPGIKRKWRVHGAAVIASWGVTAGWIAIELAFPPHRTEAVLWRASVALMCVAASSCLLIIWAMRRDLIEPINDQQYAFRMGYHAGYADAEAVRHDRSLRLLVAPTENANGKHH